jgi:hypothetical protein
MFSGCTSLQTIGAIDTTGTGGVSIGMFPGGATLTSPNGQEQTDLASASGYDFN